MLYAWLIVDPVIEDILVLEEQDFNPSLVVVAVSGWDPVWGQSVLVWTSSTRQSSLVRLRLWVRASRWRTMLSRLGSCSECQTYSRSKLRLHW